MQLNNDFLWLDDPGFKPQWGQEIFCPPTHPDWPCGPSILLYNGYWGSFLGVKWPGHSVDHPPPTRAEVKNV